MSTSQAISAAASGTFSLGGDLTVNRLGYGAMRITGAGIWGLPADKPAALATLRRAVDLGVNLIDTADSYGPGTSEELIADALHPYPAGLVIATKGGLTHGHLNLEFMSTRIEHFSRYFIDLRPLRLNTRTKG